jgi:hypothetical protein
MDWESELDEVLGLSPSASPAPSPTSDHSSGFVYDPCVAYTVSEREGSPARAKAAGRRRPSKRRCCSSGAPPTPGAAAGASSPTAPAAAAGQRQGGHGAGGTPPAAAGGAPAGASGGTAAHAPLPPSHRAGPAAGSPLQALPLQLLLRLLSFLSAQDLTAAAQASALLRPLADEPVLWRRLYCARWGKPRGPQQPKTWKVRRTFPLLFAPPRQAEPLQRAAAAAASLAPPLPTPLPHTQTLVRSPHAPRPATLREIWESSRRRAPAPRRAAGPAAAAAAAGMGAAAAAAAAVAWQWQRRRR